jgi:CRISPR-associated endoribonuclease Cas6
MQLFLTLAAPEIVLPLAYRHILQSMLYQALAADPAYSQALHASESDSGRPFKLYTFSQLQGNYTVRDRHICFTDRVQLEIRSTDDSLILRWLHALTVGTQHRLGCNTVTVTHCTVENRVISDSEVSIRTCSPIVAYLTHKDGKTEFFSPAEDLFYSLTTANAQRKWKKCFGTAPPALSIRPRSSGFCKQVTMYKTTRITAWDGSFVLKSTPEMLTMLYNLGLGTKSSQGFGMFSCIRKKQTL